MNDDLLLGVAVLIWRGPEFLMLKRAGAHGAGTWSVPGGHLDPGEWPDEAAAREMREETGLSARQALHPVSFDWSSFPEVGRRYVTLIFTTSVHADDEFRILEPSKAAEMRWVSPWGVPQPVFEPLAALFRQEPWVLERARAMVIFEARLGAVRLGLSEARGHVAASIEARRKAAEVLAAMALAIDSPIDPPPND